MDTCCLEVNDFVPKGEGKLLRLNFTGDVDAREGPVQDGDRPSEHTLHRVLGNTLSVAAPLHSNGARTAYIRDNDGRSDITSEDKPSVRTYSRVGEKEEADSPRTVALNPSILGEDKSIQAFTKVLTMWLRSGSPCTRRSRPTFSWNRSTVSISLAMNSPY